MLAVKWLGCGASIQQVAADLGYESTPSFVTMFRKDLARQVYGGTTRQATLDVREIKSFRPFL
jgi:AraC-like DNA-binding protein